MITHHNGWKTGILMRTHRRFMDRPPPSAYGQDEQEILRTLEIKLLRLEAEGEDDRQRYLFTESFEMGSTTVNLHPETAIAGQRVVGARAVPLSLSFAYTKATRGGYRVVLPRFDWWLLLEKLELAPEVLCATLASALAGEEARWIYDFRREGPERILEWAPTWAPSPARRDEEDDFAGRSTLMDVADALFAEGRHRSLSPLVGSHESFRPLEARLLGERPPSLLLVGGPGVGKTTWVRRLARFLLTLKRQGRRVPHPYVTSRDRIMAGQKYLGMWQARCLELLRELSDEPIYLSVGRLMDLFLEAPGGGSIGEIFGPALRQNRVRFIAEATEDELEAVRRAHPSIVAAFTTIRLEEPDPREVPALLAEYLEKLGASGRVRPEGLVRLVRHLADFVPGERFPGKAYRALTGLVEVAPAGPSDVPLGALEVSRAFSRQSGLPVELLADEHALPAETIAAALRARVIGQDAACNVAASVIARLKAGMQDPARPVAALFFVGPTGVGKTELAKQMARFMYGAGLGGGEDRLIRLDMSEYLLPGSAQRLLTVEAGAGASLVERVRQEPLAVVLLDEIEKAHPEVFDLLLGVLGEGRLTDARGRLVDFRMAVFVLTSNLGVSERAEIGFGGQPSAAYERHVKDHFRPELFARLDRVVPFAPLGRETVAKVVDILLEEIGRRVGLARRRLELRLTSEARARLAELGHHPTRGARPLKRTLEDRVVAPLAVRLAEDLGLSHQTVWVATGEESPGAVPEGATCIEL